MSGPVSYSAFNDLKGAHNALTKHHNELFDTHNKTVEFIDAQARLLKDTRNLAEADALRLNGAVQVQNGHTQELAGLQARINQLADRLTASEQARAESERARQASEQARLEDKRLFEDRIKRLEENSTGTTALTARIATLEEQKTKYAARLLQVEEAMAEVRKSNGDLKAIVVAQSTILEDLAINDLTLNKMLSNFDKKLDRVLDAVCPAASKAPSQPAPSTSLSPEQKEEEKEQPPVSPIRLRPVFAKLIELQKQIAPPQAQITELPPSQERAPLQNSIIQLPVSALRHPESEARQPEPEPIQINAKP